MKTCKDCKKEKPLSDYYKNSALKDGKMSRCIDCLKVFSQNVKLKCSECGKTFKTSQSEVNRGGGKVCSRKCYYIRLKRTRPKEEKSWAWKGDSVGKEALHNWVQKHQGKPNRCEHCETTNAKVFDWANISGKYKRDLYDWVRLCRKCHAKFDYPERSKKWKKSVEKLGWKVTKIK